jgi:hypothetical protein
MFATKLNGPTAHSDVFNAMALIACTAAVLLISILLHRCCEAPAQK